MTQGTSFGAAADDYERYRSGYPDEVGDAVLAHARRPVHSALEIGAGTGKATRVFATRGIEVTALEPDAEMARVLAREVPLHVEITTFEQFRSERRFDLLFSAAAFHWTDPDTRWARVVELLAPGGVLALFGHPSRPVDPDLNAAIEAIEHETVPAAFDPGHGWTFEDMAGAEGLSGATQRTLPGSAIMAADDYLGRVSTASGYNVLSPTARADALRRVRAVLPDEIEVDLTVTLHLARRARRAGPSRVE